MPGTSSVGEKRAWVRYPTSLYAVCWLGSPDVSSSWTSKVQDISMGGFCIVHSQGMAPGTQVNVLLQSNGVSLAGPLEARVMHARLDENGAWLMGCQFVKELGEAEQRVLL